MDGVLTDSEPLINAAAVEMFRERGVPVAPRISTLSSARARPFHRWRRGARLPLDIEVAKRRTYEIYLAMARAAAAFRIRSSW
jgi:beta-phosphoglucomutase-like phosphatase (HAD superfamily)